MPRFNWTLLLAGVALSVLLSVLFQSLLFILLPFLFVPLFRRRGDLGRRCARCGFQTVDPEVRYCPRDGRRLGP